MVRFIRTGKNKLFSSKVRVKIPLIYMFLHQDFLILMKMEENPRRDHLDIIDFLILEALQIYVNWVLSMIPSGILKNDSLKIKYIIRKMEDVYILTPFLAG